MWGVFVGVILALLIFDLSILHRKPKEINVRESCILSAFYISLGLLFTIFVWHYKGPESAKLYLTGFLIEQSLSIDNIFVISLIFSYLAIPPQYQYRVLFWGILSVIVLRGIMIGLGATIVSEFSWVLYIFAAFLIITGVKMMIMGDKPPDIANNPLLKWMRKHLKITDDYHGNKFVVYLQDDSGKKYRAYTPLFVALIMVEFVDIIFAVDSVPAIFAITTDPFIVYTSNIFAILGLRALFFALQAVIHRFKYLKYSLALVLVFIGSKVYVAGILGLEKVPPAISLSVTIALIAGGIIVSLVKTKSEVKTSDAM